MAMKLISVNQLMAMKPCDRYTRESITTLFSGRDSLGAADFALLDIPIEDRIWVICVAFIPDKLQSLTSSIVASIPDNTMKAFATGHMNLNLWTAMQYHARSKGMNYANEMNRFLQMVVKESP